jgi:hypothetical protein
MKTFIFADDALTGGKDENEIEDKLNEWTLIIKVYGLKMNVDKMVTEDFRNTNFRIKVNDNKVLSLHSTL